MASDSTAMNVNGVRQLVGSKMNKVPYGAGFDVEGVDGDMEDAFTLKLSDDELIALKNQWENKYRGYEAKIKSRQEMNKQYYLGKQEQGSSVVADMPIASNLMFEAEETFLPAALAKNPDPVVWSDNTKEGTDISNTVKTMLQYHADTLVLRRKLNRMTRMWSVDFLGVIKHGWNDEIKEISSETRKAQDFIFDPDATIDEYGDYVGGPLGERVHCTAQDLVDLFPKHKEYITIIVDGMMGTDVTYTEWWNDDYCFYTFKEKVLDKNKNPHFNYTQKQVETDEDGMQQEVEVPGTNHFAKPKMPYTFLSVFSFGDHPHDETGLIEQNIPNQNRVTRRTNQIDTNLSRANNSIALSENNFNQETGKQAARALEQGHPVLVPAGGPISEAIHQFDAPGFPAAAFTELENSKQDLRSIFGTQGITASQPNEDETARGMILNQEYDNTRIGGGIGDALEQVADNIFNWWVQLYYVYYDDEHFAAIMGQMKAVEYVTLTSADLNRRIVVSVSPNSMKPKDEITVMNQAMTLYEGGAIGPKTLLTVINFPDPQGSAEDGVLWALDKNAYMQLNFPEMAAKLMQIQLQAMGGTPQPAGGAPAAQPAPGESDPSLAASPASASLQSVPLPSLNG